MMGETLLFEIGTEELPARFVPWGMEELRRLAEEEFRASRLFFQEMSFLGTPRRLALLVEGLEEKQEDLVQTVRGPLWRQAFDPNGNPTRVAVGFAKSKGVPVESLVMREQNGLEYAFAEIREIGRQTFDLLPELLPRILKRLVFPKNMYWEDPTIRFARPIRWIVALWGDRVVPFSAGSVESDRYTRGHRFLGAKHVEIEKARDYLGRLYDEFVIADPQKRREKMLIGIASVEKEIGGRADLDPSLIDENVELVEYPVVFYGSFDQDFLSIPKEVLTTTMKHHQRYFPVYGEGETLLPYFIGISNNQATNMETVREGNERVLKARFSDAAFFWEEDLKQPLSARVEELKNILYQENLGSLYDKMIRVRSLSAWLCDETGNKSVLSLVDRAVFLSKADLVTSMVYEFPELQGVMGREYAKRNGEPSRVAQAIEEQYLPRFAGDRLPKDIVGALIGLADRADTLVACHKAGLQPTGSQDPYGLRRAARCINEIIWGLSLDVDVKALFTEAAEGLEADKETLDAVFDFFKQRLYIQLREKGYSHELAMVGVGRIWERPLQVIRLLDALSEALPEEWFKSLVIAAVRVRNILSKANEDPQKVDPSLFETETERAFFAAVSDLSPHVRQLTDEYRWSEAIHALGRLEPVITKFFEDVLVMAPVASVRANRLALLKLSHDLFLNVCELGLLK